MSDNPQGRGGLTVATRLHRGFDVSNTLHGDTVLVIAIDVLVLQLANLVEEHTQLIRDVGDILVAAFAPDGQLLLD
jgi:hypothetical protein